jgi:hypothetical protein
MTTGRINQVSNLNRRPALESKRLQLHEASRNRASQTTRQPSSCNQTVAAKGFKRNHKPEIPNQCIDENKLRDEPSVSAATRRSGLPLPRVLRRTPSARLLADSTSSQTDANCRLETYTWNPSDSPAGRMSTRCTSSTDRHPLAAAD